MSAASKQKLHQLTNGQAMVGNTGLLPSGDQFPGLVDSIPMHRLCEPEEVANAVVFYAKTGFTTGQSLIIAGGLK